MAVLPQTISMALASMSHPQLFQYGLTLTDGIPLVTAYDGFKPTMKEGLELINAYGMAVANASKGSEAARQLRDALNKQVIELLASWSHQALDATPHDPVSWSAAHFNLTKGDRQLRPAPATPSKLVLADGPAKGSVVVRQNPQRGTKAYVYEYAPLPAEGEKPQWQFCLGNTGSCVIAGLSSGQPYLFRCGAWNGTGPVAYSAEESRYVQ